jgi:Cu2+-exporting ATPase
MRSDPLDVAAAITIGRGTRSKERQNLAWAVGYNSIAIPIAAGALEPLGFTLSPAVGALSMSGSSVIVALNAISLRRLRLPDEPDETPAPPRATTQPGAALPEGR